MPNKNKIETNVIPEEDRLDFIPNEFVMTNVPMDIVVFNVASGMLKGYNGGYWEYAIATVRYEHGDHVAKVPFMLLESEDPVFVINPFTSEEFEVDSTLAGMIITSYAALRLYGDLEGHKANKIGKVHGSLCDLIYDYAEQHGMMNQAFGMMD